MASSVVLFALNRIWVCLSIFGPLLVSRNPIMPHKHVTVNWQPVSRVLRPEDSFRPRLVKRLAEIATAKGVNRQRGSRGILGHAMIALFPRRQEYSWMKEVNSFHYNWTVDKI